VNEYRSAFIAEVPNYKRNVGLCVILESMKQETPLQEVSPDDLDQALCLYGTTMMGMGMIRQHLRNHNRAKGALQMFTSETDKEVRVIFTCPCQNDEGNDFVFAEGSFTRIGLKEAWEESIRSVVEHDRMRLGGA
jgi:hypothetical protein